MESRVAATSPDAISAADGRTVCGGPRVGSIRLGLHRGRVRAQREWEDPCLICRSSSRRTTRKHNIQRVYERLRAVLEQLGVEWEIIFSVDPSTDGTEELIRELRRRDPRVKMLRFSRRFGQPAATLAGMQARRATPCVVIDCDLQDPPELIADMVARWREGFDVVYAQRRSRAGRDARQAVVAAVGYRVIAAIADVEIPPNTGDFRLMSRRVVRPRRRAERDARLPARPGRARRLPADASPLRPRPARRRQRQVQPLLRLAA